MDTSKYGAQIDTSTPQASGVPSGVPTGVSKYGTALSSEQVDKIYMSDPNYSRGSTFGNFAKGLVSAPLTTVARPFQAIAQLAGATSESVDKFSSDISSGLIAPVPQNFGDVKKDVGRAAQTVALGAGPVAGGALFGAGASVEQGNDFLSTETAIQTVMGLGAGKVLGLVGKPVFDVAGKVIGKVTPQYLKTVVAKGAGAIEEFAASHNILPEKIAGALNKGVQGAENVMNKPFNMAGDMASNAVSSVAGTVKSVAKSTGISRIPSNIKTNIASKIEEGNQIKKLATNEARTAVEDGINIVDVKNLQNISKNVNGKEARKLIKSIKDFEIGDKTKDPIEVVGSPIVSKLKQLDKKSMVVGKKIGEVANTIGALKKPEVQNAVFERLSNTSGLKGLKIKNGLLNFSDTQLTSALTKADRKVIQKAFTDSLKNNGLKAHKFRQELFEILDGKKRSLENMTGTQEEALQAIRQGLADVLDTKNLTYKKLNQQYAKIVRPVTDMRKIMRAIPGATDDILEMNAGIIARRLTSTSLSQGNVRAILKALDSATKAKGSTTQSVEALQDLYNILNKYYDISPATGFQGQIKEAVEGGVVASLTKGVKGFAGQSSAVRQKSLENLLEKILK